jgi:hypothetical protein
MACEDALQFDVTSASSDYASQYAVFSFVNQQNYEEMKQKFSASVPEYFSGSYDQFSKRRSELTHLFQEAGVTTLHKSYFTRALSAEGAKAYAICIAQQTQKAISAWIEAATDTKVVVGLRCGLGGNVTVDYSCIGPQPDQNSTGTLNAGGQTALMFSYDPAVDFVVAFNVKISPANAQDMVVLELPKRRRFEKKVRTTVVEGFVVAGAGGNGNTAGNPRVEDAELVAPAGYYLNLNTTKVMESQVIGGPGLAFYKMTWLPVTNDDGRIVKITAHPTGMNGASGNTQGINRIKVSVIAEQPYIAEVIG